MISNAQAKELIDALCEEQALVIGGMVAVREIDDAQVWRLMKSFDSIRRKVLRRLDNKFPPVQEGSLSEHPDLTRHPAVESFLLGLRRT